MIDMVGLIFSNFIIVFVLRFFLIFFNFLGKMKLVNFACSAPFYFCMCYLSTFSPSPENYFKKQLFCCTQYIADKGYLDSKRPVILIVILRPVLIFTSCHVGHVNPLFSLSSLKNSFEQL